MEDMQIPEAAKCEGLAFAIDRDLELWVFEADTGTSIGDYRNTVRSVTGEYGPLRWMVPLDRND